MICERCGKDRSRWNIRKHYRVCDSAQAREALRASKNTSLSTPVQQQPVDAVVTEVEDNSPT